MVLTDCQIFRYSLPLVRPIRLKSVVIRHREGFLIRLIDRHGGCGIGDVAPLPGFSRETPDHVRNELIAFRKHVTGRLSLSLDQIWPDNAAVTPSVRFGIESALWQLVAERQNILPCHYFNELSKTHVTVNAILLGSTPAVIEKARQIGAAKSYPAVKLKVGGRPLPEDIRLVSQIRSILPDTIRLRLDANRQWDLQQAGQFARQITGTEIEYIEEPCASFADTVELRHRFPALPVALDESLRDLGGSISKELAAFAAVILKPTLMGGVFQSAAWIEQAQQLGITPVITSSFESGVGLLTLAHLAALTCRDVPVGLDTASWFDQDVLQPKFDNEAGRINLKQWGLPLSLNDQLLTEIDDA